MEATNMNEVINAILTRISVRKFTDQRIEDEKLKLIADCAKAAPTGKNRQARKFTIVHNRKKFKNSHKPLQKYITAAITVYTTAMLFS